MFYCMCAFMGQAAWNKHDNDDDDTHIYSYTHVQQQQ